MRLTINAVTKAIRALGNEDELVRGNGYFYFAGPTAAGFYSQSVYVYRLTDLTLDQWVEAYKDLAGSRIGRKLCA